MNAAALTLVDHVPPEVPMRQFVLTMPFPLRFPLTFDGELLGCTPERPHRGKTSRKDLTEVDLFVVRFATEGTATQWA